jgi:hypothetical protein
VEKVRGSDDDLPMQLEADQLDRLSGRTRLGSPSGSVMSEHLATDYRAVSGLETPTSSQHVPAYSYAPPDPRLVQQVEMARSGASIPRVFPGEEDFGVPVGQGKESSGTGSLYILDASWQDFVAQLGF